MQPLWALPHHFKISINRQTIILFKFKQSILAFVKSHHAAPYMPMRPAAALRDLFEMCPLSLTQCLLSIPHSATYLLCDFGLVMQVP